MGPKQPKSGRDTPVSVLPTWEPALVSARLEEVKAAEGQSRRRGGSGERSGGGSGRCPARGSRLPEVQGGPGRAVNGPDVRRSPPAPLPPATSVALRVSLLLLSSALSFLGSGCQVSARSELFINC